MTTLVYCEEKPPSAAVIFLHGLGDSPSGWASFCEKMSRIDCLSHVKFILPEAPIRQVECNGNMKMTSWMDIKTIPIAVETEAAARESSDLQVSIKMICDLIENCGVPHDRVVVAGFSQGAALSLAVSLEKTFTEDKPLRGCIILSGWCLKSCNMKKLVEKKRASDPKTSYFIGHGDSDNVVLTECGDEIKGLLDSVGETSQFSKYSMLGHGSCTKEEYDVIEFLEKVIPKK